MFRLSVVATLVACSSIALAGPLDPPAGPVQPTGKPLDAIEPRVCLNDLAGDEGAVVIITEPGQYFLDADVVGEAGKHGIRVVAQGDVRIDLNGFSLTGVPGALNGIDMDFQQGAADTRLEVKCWDGSCRSTISGWGGDGVRTSGVVLCECSHLLVEKNGGNGITHLHAEGVVHRDIATRNCLGDGTHVTPPVQATPGNGVTHRFQNCRARSNGGSGWDVDARDNAYQVAFDDCYACGNTGDGIRVAEDHTSYGTGGGGGGGRIALRATACRDSGGDGVHVSIPCASPCVVSLHEVSCVSNGGDGMEIDAVGTALPHFGAACAINDSEFSSNGANGLRSENPLHTQNTTCAENALYGTRLSGGDDSTQMYCGTTSHLVANGSGGLFGGPGRFMQIACSVSDNGGNGIETTDGCLLLTDCSVVNNDGAGAVTNGTLNVVSSNFRRNDGGGIRCVNGECVAEDMVCEFNGTPINNAGGATFTDCPDVTLRRCVFNGNTGPGVQASSGVGPVRWMAPEMISKRNSGPGIDLDNVEGGVLERCATSDNGGVGMLLRSGCLRCRVEDCSSTDDVGGGIHVQGSGTIVLRCRATANAVGAFDFGINNFAATVIDVTGLATNRDCNANIVY